MPQVRLSSLTSSRMEGARMDSSWLDSSKMDFLRLGSEETPRTREAAKLLQHLEDEAVATWWERCVDTTIACRSYSRTSIEDLFGLPSGALGAHGSLGGCWDIGVDRLDLVLDKPRTSASSNRLTVPVKVTLT